MTKQIEIKPMVIPVINHAYGIDNGFDMTERATTIFEEVSYEIFRCSHGLVKYEQDSFVRVNKVPEFDKNIATIEDEEIANVFNLIHYLNWNKGVSVFDRVCAGFKGEFWLYGSWFDDFANISIRSHGYIPTMGIPYNRQMYRILLTFVDRLRMRMRPTDWPFEGDARKWLSRLPEKYWIIEL